MLYITFGEHSDCDYSIDSTFNLSPHAQWMEDPEVIEMIKDIDNVQVVSPGIIRSWLGNCVSADKLSSGVKLLILLKHYPKNDIMWYGSCAGDNCAKWILKIAATRDIRINLQHFMDFGGKEDPMEAVIENTGETVHTTKEYRYVAYRYAEEGIL